MQKMLRAITNTASFKDKSAENVPSPTFGHRGEGVDFLYHTETCAASTSSTPVFYELVIDTIDEFCICFFLHIIKISADDGLKPSSAALWLGSG